jgi:hypothetical protein
VRIFLDANVLFSAAHSAGAVRRFLEQLVESGHELCVDGYVVGEARRNLASKAPGAGAVLDRLLLHMSQVRDRPAAVRMGELEFLPEKDRPVLAAAIRGGCGALVTGDVAHFGRWFGKTVGGVTIHSPRSLHDALFA